MLLQAPQDPSHFEFGSYTLLGNFAALSRRSKLKKAWLQTLESRVIRLCHWFCDPGPMLGRMETTRAITAVNTGKKVIIYGL